VNDEALLQIRGVTRRFGEVTALDDVSIEIRDNEFFALLGPSGCGKTTLLRILAGLDDPDEGSVTLAGQDLVAIPAHRRPVNLMFQSYALFPHLNVARNVAYGLERERRPRAEIRERVAEALTTVGLDGLERRRIQELSGGQRQRVALARAIVKRPKILLLDEPLGALDKQIRTQMQRELKRLQHEVDITFVVVTHDQEEAMSMADRIAVLRHGRVEQVASPAELYDRPATRFVAEFIGSTNLFGEGEDLRSVRPERMSISHTALTLPDGHRLRGRVADVSFYGGVSHCHVEVTEGPPGTPPTVSVAVIGPPSVRPGEDVWIGWSPEHEVPLTR
jgi:spermidine/putrescine transport system ATP-binding protein/putrescine transport system ATP-binding protein